MRFRGPVRLPADACVPLTRRPYARQSWTRGEAGELMDGIEPPHAQERAAPGDGTQEVQRLGLGGWAVGRMDRSTARRRWSSWPSSARSPARLFGTAGAGNRSATPSRRALRRSASPSQAGDTDEWYGGCVRAPPRVGASQASAAGAGHGSPAGGRET